MWHLSSMLLCWSSLDEGLRSRLQHECIGRLPLAHGSCVLEERVGGLLLLFSCAFFSLGVS